jgi:hypothetical protein
MGFSSDVHGGQMDWSIALRSWMDVKLGYENSLWRLRDSTLEIKVVTCRAPFQPQP